MSKSIPLEFEIYCEELRQYILCQYESESRQRNLLMRVQIYEFSVDVADLVTDHPKLYKSIANAMKNNAESYWNGVETKQLTAA